MLSETQALTMGDMTWHGCPCECVSETVINKRHCQTDGARNGFALSMLVRYAADLLPAPRLLAVVLERFKKKYDRFNT